MTAAAINRLGLVVVALLTLAAPWFLPLLVDGFWVDIYAEMLIWSLLAASVNLLFGYVGLLSFGQALFFGMGMYGVAIGVAKLGLGFWPAFGLGVVMATAMALVAGALAVRLTWHYFAIITVVFSLIFYFAALSWKPLTGGDDGLSFTMPPIVSIGEWELSLTDPTVQYYFIIAIVGVCYALMGVILKSPLGAAFRAVKENDHRAALIGLNVYLIRLTAFVIAGFIAGTAGALFAFFGRYASASYMFYHVSGEAVVWAIIGGAGTLLGPVVGTSLLIVLREELSHAWEHYLILVGIIVILVVIFAPKGLGGLWQALVRRIARPETPPPSTDAKGEDLP
ncbi:branched-chain amino acid ABC transporter permease [Thalassospiraceae bacterium LMO-SO8]|nr:branched-chain amino acid ABC transporter permease [Alphaproteobacteria bacterium LMO-S08]WND75452.1 branched-chain amino acid ABC transporter permease [Thalassospiraceae bacterium LMO-SO8]